MGIARTYFFLSPLLLYFSPPAIIPAFENYPPLGKDKLNLKEGKFLRFSP